MRGARLGFRGTRFDDSRPGGATSLRRPGPMGAPNRSFGCHRGGKGKGRSFVDQHPLPGAVDEHLLQSRVPVLFDSWCSVTIIAPKVEQRTAAELLRDIGRRLPNWARSSEREAHPGFDVALMQL